MKKWMSLILICMLLFSCAACATRDVAEQSDGAEASGDALQAGASPEKDAEYGAYSLACIYSEVTGDFWSIVYNGCKAALQELEEAYGITGYCVAPANSTDYVLQMDLIEAAVQKQVDGIVLSPVNAESIGTFITDYFTEENWTPIVVVDRSCNSESDVLVAECVSDTYAMGRAAGELAAQAMGAKGNYICIGISPENENWVNRSQGAIDWITENAPEMAHIGNEPYWRMLFTEQQQLAFIQDTITSNPGPLCFLTSSEAAINVVVSMVSEVSAERQQEIQVIGYDFSKTGLVLINRNVMYGTVGQNPYLLGRESTYLLCDYLAGKQIEELVYIPYCVVTKNNLQTKEVVDYCNSMGISL